MNKNWKQLLLYFILGLIPILIYSVCNIFFDYWVSAIIGASIALYLRVCAPQIVKQIDEKVLGNRKHESGLPMAEWEERQRLKELDEKLQTGKYTSAEKEHLIYTANLTSENKNTLRQKHLPSQKNSL